MSNYTKLKTNLKLAITRLKLLEKKKTELSLKSRKEIADYLAINKSDRARIRVEHIIREDNYVEAMEMIEMFCDLLLARFGLIEKMKELDPGLDEAIATVLWSCPRISADIQEFKTIGEIFTQKYGKKYADACKMDTLNNVNEKVKKRLGLEAPCKLLVEQYLIEIAKNFNVAYEPDQLVMIKSGIVDENLISLREKTDDIVRRNNNNGGGGGGGATGGGDSGGFSASHNLIGFDTSEKHGIPADNLLDLNNNDTSVGGVPPMLPRTLPFGDSNVSNGIMFGHSPPPTYNLNGLENSKATNLPPYNNPQKSVPPDNEAFANAPPLPSKSNDFASNQFGEEDHENKFGSRPPSYNLSDNNMTRSSGGLGEKKQQFESAPNQNDPRDLDDDLGLPSVPDSYPNDYFNKNGGGSGGNGTNSSNKNTNRNDDHSASIDFDELTKRFNNLKSFK